MARASLAVTSCTRATSRTRRPPAPCTNRTAPASTPPSSPSAIRSLARKLGAKIHPASPVMGWKVKNGIHHLTTPGGTVRARAVALGDRRLHAAGPQQSDQEPADADPVQLDRHPAAQTDDEKQACGFQTCSPLTDTRTLRHYYRYLPDGRVQIGSRSAITGSDAENPKHLALLQEGPLPQVPGAGTSTSTTPGGAGSMSATT